MHIETLLFSISMLMCSVVLYVLGQLWFVDTRNRKLHSLFVLGITVFLWTLLNAISMLTLPQYYSFVFTLRMVTVCIIPYCLLWFFLNFSSSKLAQSKMLSFFLLLIPAIDILFLLTNPLHWLYFESYTYPRLTVGPLFWIHTAAAYVVVLLAFAVLIRHTIRYFREKPSLVWAALGTLLPYLLNILYTFDSSWLAYDLTPFGFFVAFMILAWLSYRSRLLNVKTNALANIVAALADIILIVGTDHTIVDFNFALKENFPDFTVDAGQTTIEDFTDYISSKVQSCSVNNLLDSITQTDGTKRLEGELEIATFGGIKTFVLNQQVIRTGNRITGYVINLSDISEYRAMIAEIDLQNKKLLELKDLAESASRAKSAFLANMSHEMRTPMNAIIGMAAIARSSDSTVKKDECIVKIGDASTHLLGVINDVLDMSKIEEGKLDLVVAEFDLDKMLMHTVGLVSHQIKEKAQMFKVRTDPGIPRHIVGDEQRLSQVIMNLLSNAVKFTPERGEITLRVRLLEEDQQYCTICVEVRDTGIGIELEQQKNLFSSFQQADARISRKYGGTGLGLAISKRIVEMAGGEMYFSSVPGKGSVFGFRLPVVKGTLLGKIKLENGSNGQTPRVFVVDGSLETRTYLEELAESYHFSCQTVGSGEEACGLMKQSNEPYHLVFINRNLPDMNGADLAKRIRENHWGDAIIMMAELTDFYVAEQDMIESCNDPTIQKPLFTSVIIDNIIRSITGETDAEAERSFDIAGIFDGYRVLLAEDVEINREILITLLEPTKIIIDVAHNGNEAREMFMTNSSAYDAIFMDIHMPEKDGYAATREIRALDDRWAQRVPIIAMTANVFNEDVARCLESGMNDHLGKPVNLDEVIRTLKKHLQQRSV